MIASGILGKRLKVCVLFNVNLWFNRKKISETHLLCGIIRTSMCTSPIGNPIGVHVICISKPSSKWTSILTTPNENTAILSTLIEKWISQIHLIPLMRKETP